MTGLDRLLANVHSERAIFVIDSSTVRLTTTMRRSISLFRSFAVMFVAIAISTRHAAACSAFCACDTWYGLQRASCSGRHLYSIHTGAPSGVQALDLSDNSISSLNDFELAGTGLTRIKYLNLSANSISEIGMDAFAGLADLTVLDLSRNRLHHVHADTFAGNANLRVVKLSRNNFNGHVPQLRCQSLTELIMDSCLIGHIPADTFNGLGGIRTLDLSDNMMIQLASPVVRPLPLLRKLSLAGNPWSCDAVMTELEDYLRRKKVQFTGACSKSVEPKKFERMILPSPTRKTEISQRRSSVTHEKVPKRVWQTGNEKNDGSQRDNATTCVAAPGVATASPVSPYLFVLIGFLLGSATSVVVCYVWLATKLFRCRETTTYGQRVRSDPHRILLLQNLWQFDDPVADDGSGSGAASCPGTPPPPYREVMLHPALYRASSSVVNLRGNDTGPATQML